MYNCFLHLCIEKTTFKLPLRSNEPVFTSEEPFGGRWLHHDLLANAASVGKLVIALHSAKGFVTNFSSVVRLQCGMQIPCLGIFTCLHVVF